MKSTEPSEIDGTMPKREKQPHDPASECDTTDTEQIKQHIRKDHEMAEERPPLDDLK
jgi:hypothetical protein